MGWVARARTGWAQMAATTSNSKCLLDLILDHKDPELNPKRQSESKGTYHDILCLSCCYGHPNIETMADHSPGVHLRSKSPDKIA